MKKALELYRKFQSSVDTAEHRDFGTTNGLLYSGLIGTSPAFNYGRPKLEDELAINCLGRGSGS